MGDVVDLNEQVEVARSSEDEVKFDRFLLDEGLAVLAAYRSIRDETVRMGVRVLLESLAGSDVRSRSAAE